MTTNLSISSVETKFDDRKIIINNDIEISISDANMIVKAVEKYYCMLDIIAYFNSGVQYTYEALNDKPLIDRILRCYIKLCEEARQSNFDRSVNKSECLEHAICEFKDSLSSYEIEF